MIYYDFTFQSKYFLDFSRQVFIYEVQASIYFTIAGKYGQRPETWEPWEARKYLDIQVMMMMIMNMMMLMLMIMMMVMMIIGPQVVADQTVLTINFLMIMDHD